jgi:predicted nucleotide-binding protein
MARRTAPPEPQRANLTIEQMRLGVTQIKRRIADLEAFDPNVIQKRWGPELETLATSIEETLGLVFGHNTVEYHRYKDAANLDNGPSSLRLGPDFGGGHYDDRSEARQYAAEGIQRSILLLQQAVRGLEEQIGDRAALVVAPAAIAGAATAPDLLKIFVVHGRDNEAKNEVARFLERIGLEAIILHERPNLGRHLLMKFQEEAEGVGFAVVLITPDDDGALTGEAPRKRARQNVVFELGFLIGRLGPSRVAALVKGEVERPSDFDGVGYITLDSAGGWKGLLARELKAARVPFDAMKVFEA